VSIKAE